MAHADNRKLAHATPDDQLALLSPAEVSLLLRVSVGHPARLRVEGNGPNFVKLGRRPILYRRLDLQEFIDSRIRRSTSDRGVGDRS